MYKPNYVVEEDKVFTKTYETASWYKEVLVKKGDYPIKYTDISGHEVAPEDSYYGIVVLPGKVVSSYFENRVFTSSSSEVDKCVGEDETVVLQIYSYCLKEKEEGSE